MLTASFPAGTDIPTNRVVVVDDHDLFALAGPSDANYIGFTQSDDDGDRIVALRGGAFELIYPPYPLADYRKCRPRSSPFVLLQRAPGARVVTGQPVFVADEGRIAGAGSVRCGIAGAWLAGDVFVVLPD